MIPFYEKNENQMRAFNSERLQFPAHLHGELELVYVKHGNLRLEIQGEEFVLEKGDFACIFPEVIHCYKELESDGANEKKNQVLVVICGLQMMEETAAIFHNRFPENPVFRCGSYPEEIEYALRGLEKEAHAGKEFLIQKGLLLFLLGKLIPLLQLRELSFPASYQLLHGLLSYMEEHFRENISLSSLAEHLCISKYYLSRIFSKQLQSSFTDYLNQMRLEYAMSLIRKTNQSFLNIALDSGFESQRTFNRAFQKLYGMTPSQYAEEVKKKSGKVLA